MTDAGTRTGCPFTRRECERRCFVVCVLRTIEALIGFQPEKEGPEKEGAE